ncbi:alpha/beta hydrolase [Mycobacterium sp. 94-17]|uniref:alpha/beta fold hydrolase n=1 Tax=Mycobacterium sp. 94-17 TaxID=2986147 RepID=UPI002D1F5202|nr:alpha/beta hydrolase [Mycobacterium sp. 94-17]MEB4210356.1 alpha/beta hydrolase [Mycobacterium sp. 94-17]
MIGQTCRTARNGDVTLAYEVFGPGGGAPLLLLMGVGMQMLLWHDDFCRELVARGFQVARMDNRDVGLSTHLTDLGEPSLFHMIARPRAAARYSLGDMARDAVAVVDDLGWSSVNVVGGSLGGMIAQTMAIEHRGRVRSLTSLASAPSARIGRARIGLSIKVARLLQRPVHSAAEAGQQLIDLYDVIGTAPGNYPTDTAWLAEVGAESFRRAYDPAGKLRQQAAMLAADDRTAALATLRLPSLIIHGTADPMIRPAGGRATAKAIPGARLLLLDGVGHGAFPRAVWPNMIDGIRAVAR